jgi:hypothetical protein
LRQGKEKYVKEKSALYGRTASDETKALMSIKKSKENNPLSPALPHAAAWGKGW